MISPAGGVDSLSASAPTTVVPGVVDVNVEVMLAAESASPPPQTQQPTRASTPFVSTYASIIPQSESQPTPGKPEDVQYKAVSYSRHPSPSWFSQPGVSAQLTTTEGAATPPPHTQHASVDWTPDSEA